MIDTHNVKYYGRSIKGLTKPTPLYCKGNSGYMVSPTYYIYSCNSIHFSFSVALYVCNFTHFNTLIDYNFITKMNLIVFM